MVVRTGMTILSRDLLVVSFRTFVQHLLMVPINIRQVLQAILVVLAVARYQSDRYTRRCQVFYLYCRCSTLGRGGHQSFLKQVHRSQLSPLRRSNVAG